MFALASKFFYDSFFPLQSFAESASIGMVDFDFEKIEAVLREFPQILFFYVINIQMDHGCSSFLLGPFESGCLKTAQWCPALPERY